MQRLHPAPCHPGWNPLRCCSRTRPLFPSPPILPTPHTTQDDDEVVVMDDSPAPAPRAVAPRRGAVVKKPVTYREVSGSEAESGSDEASDYCPST